MRTNILSQLHPWAATLLVIAMIANSSAVYGQNKLPGSLSSDFESENEAGGGISGPTPVFDARPEEFGIVAVLYEVRVEGVLIHANQGLGLVLRQVGESDQGLEDVEWKGMGLEGMESSMGVYPRYERVVLACPTTLFEFPTSGRLASKLQSLSDESMSQSVWINPWQVAHRKGPNATLVRKVRQDKSIRSGEKIAFLLGVPMPERQLNQASSLFLSNTDAEHDSERKAFLLGTPYLESQPLPIEGEFTQPNFDWSRVKDAKAGQFVVSDKQFEGFLATDKRGLELITPDFILDRYLEFINKKREGKREEERQNSAFEGSGLMGGLGLGGEMMMGSSSMGAPRGMSPGGMEGAPLGSMPLPSVLDDAIAAEVARFKSKEDPNEAKDIRNRLEKMIRDQFEAARSLKQMKIAELRERLEVLESEEQSKKERRDAIIQSRVDQLLGGK